MAIWKRLLLASSVTALVTVLLTALPPAASRMTDGGRDQAVFKPVPLKRLSSENLVDSMVGLQLSLKLKRVEWKQAVLSVDLSVEGSETRMKPWMEDLELLLHLAFVRTDNVSRVLVRFVEPEGGVRPTGLNQQEYRMVAAADVRRSDNWLASGLAGTGDAQPAVDEVWRKRLRMTFAGNAAGRFAEE
jgi:hypothetical protein